ncbi:hypothetical protein BHM03_00032821 [Ensete ventricosum]|nr:hypothetical protein BHM03_00032821 [Ensete ventricosum]
MHVMLPLGFPIVVSEARLFVRKIGFKLHVMRLYHVELFYAFLLCYHSEGSKGRPTMARPLQGRPTAAKAPSLQGQPPVGAVAYSVAPTRNGSRLWAQFLWVSLTD